MRLVGLIGIQQVVILINLGSTHDLLDPLVVKEIDLQIISYNKIQVKVANGDTIQSEGKCNVVSLKGQGTIITTKFYICTLGGCDFRTNHLGFSSIAMQYSFLGQKIMLHGLKSCGI
jgi:hypothetical protein